MKITKYPQSNLLVEKNGKKLIIDIGNFTLEKYKTRDLPTPDAVLITHQHPDHMDKDALKELAADAIPIYGNSDVVKQLVAEGLQTKKVEDGVEIEISGFKIKPVDLPHCQMLWCKQCNERITGPKLTLEKTCKSHPDIQPDLVDGPPNTGFVINDLFFHPGDGIELQGLTIPTAAVPIAGPSIDYERTWKFVRSLKVQKVIPMHYTNPAFRDRDPNLFADQKPAGIEVIVLGNAQSAEI